MSDAWATLLAVIVGGCISGGVTLYSQRRSEDRTDTRDKTRLSDELGARRELDSVLYQRRVVEQLYDAVARLWSTYSTSPISEEGEAPAKLTSAFDKVSRWRSLLDDGGLAEEIKAWGTEVAEAAGGVAALPRSRIDDLHGRQKVLLQKLAAKLRSLHSQ